jgi:L,D-transpeptidase ErfK/SrfK
MATSAQNNALSRSLMSLCMGTSCLLLVLQGIQGSRSSTAIPQPRPAPTTAITAPPSPVPTTKLVVDLSDRRVDLYQQDKLKASYPVAVGQEGWETPIGDFKIFQMHKNPIWRHPITQATIPPGPDNPLGKRWIGFWADDTMVIGFHGTNQEELVGEAISHGCLRMKNADITALYRQVSLGSIVEVRP